MLISSRGQVVIENNTRRIQRTLTLWQTAQHGCKERSIFLFFHKIYITCSYVTHFLTKRIPDHQTARSRVLLQQLTIPYQVNNFSAFYITGVSLTCIQQPATRSYMSQMNPLNFSQTHILFSRLCLRLPALLYSDSPAKTLCLLPFHAFIMSDSSDST